MKIDYKIVDLAPEHEETYCMCLEEWSDEMKEAGNHKQLWYGKMKEQGLGVKLAQDERGTIGGMIQYIPADFWFEEADDLNFILCIWVHGYEEGRGNFQKKGMGTALLEAAEEDTKAEGKKGIAAWGISLPFWMRAAWFKKHGYKKIDKNGMQVLLWKPFTDEAIPPKLVKRKKAPATQPNKVTVTGFIHGWCPAQNLAYERAKRAAAEFGDAVEFQSYNTFDKEIMLEWGIVDGLFIDGKQVSTGPPPSYVKMRKLIEKRVRKLPEKK